jgi:hypothetical protein
MLAFEMRDGVAVPCKYDGEERLVTPDAQVPFEHKRERAHRLSSGGREALLYLPASEELTPRAVFAVELALCKESSGHG